MYTKISNKKKKVWSDGLVSLDGKSAVLMAMDGKVVAKQLTKYREMRIGGTLCVRNYDTEAMTEVDAELVTSGRVFVQASGAASAAPAVSSRTLKPATKAALSRGNGLAPRSANTATKGALGLSKSGSGGNAGSGRAVGIGLRPRHSPTSAGALVLHRPAGRKPDSCEGRIHKEVVVGPDGQARVPVVVDPVLGLKLRPHQREGVQFLWSCVNGERLGDQHGAILADAMGLGKTLQTITLVWTALKQSEFGRPLADKAVVVTPSSLVSNWRKEFRKWLGDHRIKPIAVTKGGAAAAKSVKDFATSSPTVHPVLIISYEMFRKHAKTINNMGASRGSTGQWPVGLVVCDEGHRLKNSDGNQTIKALMACPARRRVILSGTPIQNDLEEFYALANFVNPNVFGPPAVFRRVFQTAIERGRDKSASADEHELGRARSQELARIAGQFVLRRTSEILERHLPPKTEYVVFVRPAEVQTRVYRHVVGSAAVSGAMLEGGATPAALQLIGALRQLANHPDLVYPRVFPEAAQQEGFPAIADSAAHAASHFAVELGVQQQQAKHKGRRAPRRIPRIRASRKSDGAAAVGAGGSGSGNGGEEKDEEDVGAEELVYDDVGLPAVAASSRQQRRNQTVEEAFASASGKFPSNYEYNACRVTLPGAGSCERPALQRANAWMQLGKLGVVDHLLGGAIELGDKTVVVATSTQMLDVVAMLCMARGYAFLRLDGSTSADKRMGLVDAFNRSSSPVGVFLLSSKAGGTGLNLIGANRLIMCDCDWNPAVDRQAMARVWRDGQKKSCYTYRLITQNTIEEKVFQRQVLKEEVSAAVVDDGAGAKRSFAKDDLRDLFRIQPPLRPDVDELVCDTLTLMRTQHHASAAVAASTAGSSSWGDYTGAASLHDPLLRDAIERCGGAAAVAYVHAKHVNQPWQAKPTDGQGEAASGVVLDGRIEGQLDESRAAAAAAAAGHATPAAEEQDEATPLPSEEQALAAVPAPATGSKRARIEQEEEEEVQFDDDHEVSAQDSRGGDGDDDDDDDGDGDDDAVLLEAMPWLAGKEEAVAPKVEQAAAATPSKRRRHTAAALLVDSSDDDDDDDDDEDFEA